MWGVFRDSVTGLEATVQTEKPCSVDRAAVLNLVPDYVQNLGETQKQLTWLEHTRILEGKQTGNAGDQWKQKKKKKKNSFLVNQSGRDLIRSIIPLRRNFPPGFLNGW